MNFKLSMISSITASLLLGQIVNAAECPNSYVSFNPITESVDCTIPSGVEYTAIVIGKGNEGSTDGESGIYGGDGGGTCIVSNIFADENGDSLGISFLSDSSQVDFNNGTNSIQTSGSSCSTDFSENVQTEAGKEGVYEAGYYYDTYGGDAGLADELNTTYGINAFANEDAYAVTTGYGAGQNVVANDGEMSNDYLGPIGEGAVFLFWNPYDKPTMTISSTTVTNGTTSNDLEETINFVVSESTSDFTIDDINVTNATLSDFTGSGLSYSVKVTAIAEGNISINIPADKFVGTTSELNNTISNTFSWTYSAANSGSDQTGNNETTNVISIISDDGEVSEISIDSNNLKTDVLGNTIVSALDGVSIDESITNQKSFLYENGISSIHGKIDSSTGISESYTVQNNITTKTTSNVHGTQVLLLDTGTLKTSVELDNKLSSSNINLDGSSNHFIKLVDGNITKFSSLLAGTQTTIDSNGNIESNTTLVNLTLSKVKSLIDGNSSIEIIGSDFTTNIGINVKGSITTINSSGDLEVSVPPQIKVVGEDYYKAVITSDENGKVITKFNLYNSGNYLLQESGLKINTTPYAADSNSNVKENNGTLIIETITSIDENIKF